MLVEETMKALEVRPVTDHMLQFHVASATHPEQPPYRVDLAANDGFGRCECKHWLCRIQSRINEGHKLPREMQCHHVAAARDYLCDQLIAKIAHMQKQQQRKARFY